MALWLAVEGRLCVGMRHAQVCVRIHFPLVVSASGHTNITQVATVSCSPQYQYPVTFAVLSVQISHNLVLALQFIFIIHVAVFV